MSRVSERMLELWDQDEDAGFVSSSRFTRWWTSLVERSSLASKDIFYRRCVASLDLALIYSVHATQSDIRSMPDGLSYTMQAMELLQSCDARMIPADAQTFDLEDLDQATLLVAAQFDSVIGTDEWTACLQQWFERVARTTRRRILLGAQSVEVIRGVIDEGEDIELESLDQAHWVLAMLEWLKMDDPSRDLGLDLDELQDALSQLTSELRPVLPNFRRAGAVARDSLAPKSFWWRH